MANLSVKLSLDASGYTSGIREANNATKAYTNQISDMTKNLPNAKREMNQIKKEAQNLAVAIAQMSDAEKQSAEGQALIRHFNEIRARGAELVDAIGDVNAEMKALASDTSNLDAAKQALGVFGNTLSSVAGVIGLVTGEEEKMKKAVVMFTTVQSVLNTVTSISNALNKSSILVLKTKAIQQKAAAVATKLETAAQSQNVIVSKAATVAMKAFNAVVKANPIGLLITALITVVSLFAAFASGADDATDSMDDQKKASEELEEQHKKMAETIGEKVAETTTSFLTLQHQWTSLKTEAEQKKWIDDNASSFKKLGLNIMTVAQAQKVFVEQADDVLKLMQLMGQMAGLEAAQMDIWKDYYVKKVTRERGRTVRQYTEAGDIEKSDYALMKAIGREGVDYVTEKVTRSTGSVSAGTYAQYVEEIVKVTDKGVALINKKKQEISDKYNKIWDDAAYKVAENQVSGLNDEWKEIAVEVEKTRAGINKAAGATLVFDPLAYDPYEKSTDKTPKTKRTTQKRTVTKEHKETIKKEADKSTKEVKVGLEALEAQAQELEKQRKALIDTTTGKVAAGNEAEFNRLTKELTEVNQKIENANKLLHPEEKKEEILSYTEQLSKEIDEYKKEYELLMSKGKGSILDEDKARVNEIQNIIKEKSKQLEQANNILNDLTTEVILPEDKLIDDKIKEYQDIIDKNQLEIRINPTLSTVEKTKLKNEMDEARENKAKWEDAKEQRAAGSQYVIPEVTIGSKEKIDKKFEEYRKQVEAKWNDMQPNLSSRLKPIKLDDLLFSTEKNLLDSQESIYEWAETGINKVKDLFDKGLLPAKRAKDLIKHFNDELKKNHIDHIKVDIEANTTKFVKQMSEDTFNAIGTVNSLVSAWTSMEDTLDSNATSWQKFMAVVQMVEATYNSIIGTIEIVKSVLEALDLVKKKDIATTEENIAAKSAETTVQVTDTVAKTADVAASEAQVVTNQQVSQSNLQEATSASAAAVAEGTKSGAKMPFPANIIAIAAIMAAIVGALAMATKFKFAEGGVVGGHSYYGDKILARVNSRELVTNEKQQRKIWNAMNEKQLVYGNTQHVVVEGVVRGKDLMLVQRNYDTKTNRAK